VLFTLLSERYERGSVLLTSNLPFSKWEGIFGCMYLCIVPMNLGSRSFWPRTFHNSLVLTATTIRGPTSFQRR
jgi:DNA replication protein DnaC